MIVITINTLDKKIGLGTIISFDDDRTVFPDSYKIADLEDGITLYSMPFFDTKNCCIGSSKCFLCTDNDIIELKGIGNIPFEDKDENKAIAYMEKLEKMIEWQH